MTISLAEILKKLSERESRQSSRIQLGFDELQQRRQLEEQERDAWNSLPSTIAHRFKKIAGFDHADKEQQDLESGFVPNSEGLPGLKKQDLESGFVPNSEGLPGIEGLDEEEWLLPKAERQRLEFSQNYPSSQVEYDDRLSRLQRAFLEKKGRQALDDDDSLSIDSSEHNELSRLAVFRDFPELIDDPEFSDDFQKRFQNEETSYFQKFNNDFQKRLQNEKTLFYKELHDDYQGKVLSDLFNLSQEAPKSAKSLVDSLDAGMRNQNLKNIQFYPGGDWLAPEEPIGVQTAYHQDPLYTLYVDDKGKNLEWQQNPNWVTLAHELGHVAAQMNDPKSMSKRLEEDDKNEHVWSNSEEKRNITDIENPILKEFGRPARFGHAGLNPAYFNKPKKLSHSKSFETQLATGQSILSDPQFEDAYNSRYMFGKNPSKAEIAKARALYKKDRDIVNSIGERANLYLNNYLLDVNPEARILKRLYEKDKIYS